MNAGWIILAAGVTLLGVLTLLFRHRLARLMRVAKALATDKRLPWPVRWMFAAAIAIKAVPLPDFGIDEILLIVGALLLLGPYRKTWRSIWEETR